MNIGLLNLNKISNFLYFYTLYLQVVIYGIHYFKGILKLYIFRSDKVDHFDLYIINFI
jgi:hypothetical protein